ncbi:MAG TPA: rhodanese family protein [Steroidobacteraceae bacterium]|jgi:rhodanese-related sulfurtransferase
MSLRSISVHDAKRLIDAGALLIDIREPDEYAREHIAQARSHPVSSAPGAWSVGNASQVIFHCRSGVRTRTHADRLARAVASEGYLLEGGLDAWKKAGLPVSIDHGQPLELMRQVQLAAGSAVLVGVALGITVSPWFYALSAFVGAGLIFAGATGLCGLAAVLRRLPWNRRAMS